MLVVVVMHRLRCAALLCSGSLALGTPATVAAQFPVGAAQMSPAAVSESLAVMRTLQDRARRTPDDAALQHRLGIVAFAIERRARLPGAPPGIVPWRIRTIAEGALQAALDLEPENTVHWLALGRFYQSQPGNAERLPRIYYDRGLALARAQRDTAMVATMAMELGTLHWRHAESNWRSGAVTSGELVVTMPEPATRAATRGSTETARAAIAQGELGNAAPGAAGIAIAYPVPNGVWGAAAGDTLQATPVLLATAIRRVSEALHPWPGPTAESFYLNAETYVREAHVLRPGDAAVFQRLAGVLALEDRWAALQGLAEGYLSRAPTDPWGWMSRGLAQHRLRQNRAARESFDSAMVRFSPEERARLDRIDRILSPREAASFVASDSARRANTARALWLLADPLWSQDEEDVRTEFLARLAYAELRFTWADGSVRGADTPAGQLYLRYGPPDEVRGDYWIYRSGVMLSACMRGAQRPVRTDGEWRWEAASTACEADVRLLNDVVAWQPSNWGNVALARIDTIPTQIARFRATQDSVDVLIAGVAPLQAMREAHVTNATARADLWRYSWDSPDARRRTLDPLDSSLVMLTERVPPGRYYVRLESSVPGTLVAGRSAGTITLGPDSLGGFSTRGFGLSDVLVAARAESEAVPARWSDMRITPHFGPIAPGGEMTLVWETYALGSRAGDAEYAVTMTIERRQSRAGRIAARIVTGIAGAVGVNTSRDALTLRFERERRHADALVDHVTVALGDTPPGSYVLSIHVEDRVSGRSTERAIPLVIRDP